MAKELQELQSALKREKTLRAKKDAAEKKLRAKQDGAKTKANVTTQSQKKRAAPQEQQVPRSPLHLAPPCASLPPAPHTHTLADLASKRR